MESEDKYKGIEELQRLVTEGYENVVWTYKTYEKCADILTYRNNMLKVYQCAISFFVCALSILETKGGLFLFSEILIAVLSSSLCAEVVFFYAKNYTSGIKDYQNAARMLWILKERYKMLLLGIKIKRYTTEEAWSRYKKLMDSLQTVYTFAPRTFEKAYMQASKEIKQGGLVFDDNEKRKLIPDFLIDSESECDK